MTEAANELAELIGAHGLQGAGALGLYWVASPTLKNVGKAFGDWTDWRLRNVLGLGEKIQARREQDPRPADEQDKIHPKVLHEVIENGSWSDDDLAQEYLAGLLIAARTPDGKDENSAYLAGIVARLTADQIRLHHLIYAALHGTGLRDEYGLQTTMSQKKHSVYLPIADMAANDLVDPMGPFNRVILALQALVREGLLDERYAAGGNMKFLSNVFPAGSGPGLVAAPTTTGAEIFLRAYGVTAKDTNELLTGVPLATPLTPMPRAENAIVGAGPVG